MKNKKRNIIISTIILVVCVFSYMLFSKNGYKEYTNGQSFASLVDVLLETAKGKDTVEINEENINSIGSTYFKEGIKKGNITITGFNTNLLKDKVKFLIPVKYKFLSVMLSSEGKLELDKDYLVYTPQNFKIGKISVPKAKILNYIKSSLNKNIKIESNKILLDTKIFSNKIEIENIKEGKVDIKVNEKTKNVANKVAKASKLLENEKLMKKEISKANSVSSKDNTKNTSKKDSSKSSNDEDTDNSTSDNSSGLNGRESEMVSIMNSTIAALDSNPSYNYEPDARRVLDIYNSLSQQEKARFKSKVYNYVDVARAKSVRDKMRK